MEELMKYACLIIFGLFTVLISGAAHADPSPRVLYGTSLTYPISLENGEGLPVMSSHGAIIVIPVGGGWSVPMETGFGSGMAAFRPAPHVQVGLTYRLSDHLLFGGTLLYRYIPHWSGTPSDAHLFGTSVAPVIPITDGMTLILPVGVARNQTVHDWSASFTSKLTFTL